MTDCHLNHAHNVAVSNDVFWNPDMKECPRGVKVQLLGAGGVALYGNYDGKDKFYVAWAAVPRRRPVVVECRFDSTDCR